MNYRSVIKGKKGDVTDPLIFVIVIVSFAIILFMLAFIIPQIADGLAIAGLNNTPEGAAGIVQLSDFGTETIQRGFFLLAIGLMMSTLITSFLVRTHPIFLFLYIFILGLTIFITTYLGNAYDQLRNISILSDTLASQTLINLIMENLITIVLAVGALILDGSNKLSKKALSTFIVTKSLLLTILFIDRFLLYRFSYSLISKTYSKTYNS